MTARTPAASPSRRSADGAPVHPVVPDEAAELATLSGLPQATVARLPLYLQALTAMGEAGVTTCSSQELAEATGVSGAGVRKDLSHLGSYGTRGVGYDVASLSAQVAEVLGLTRDWPVAIVGVGNLGSALANFSGFGARGFRVVALLDADPALSHTSVGSLRVRPITDLAEVVRTEQVLIGVIATPAEAAQQVADALIATGVRSILNFAPTMLSVPEQVVVRRVDLSSELQILAFHETHRALDAVAVDGPAPVQTVAEVTS